MSNKTQLQTNNATLDGYIARINAAKEVAAGLPEAGGGGGGASVETCTVTTTGFTGITIAATIITSTGELERIVSGAMDDRTILDYKFLKGSFIIFMDKNWGIIPNGITATGAEIFGYYMQYGVAVFVLTSDTATFTFAS